MEINYGERLTALRQEKYWSREQLAEALNVSAETVRRLEKNRTTLTTDYAEALSVAYGLQLIDFWKWMCNEHL